MKKILFVAMLFCGVTVYSQNWNVNFEEAKAIANKNKKPIILVFSGSDWCAPCIKLDKDIWQSAEFKKYSDENYVLYKADFPKRKSNKLSDDLENQNKKLAEKYNSKGYFPLVVILDSENNVLGKTGYKKINSKAYISLLNSFLD
ncbi:thioredoxin family protein [Cellulophaga sp. HaHaR_3_176]|uniref:thioredoxin family protein n=1 Tax=Cellulophaga sp. HaHaR_3_176 TaxID=1942464 RepID=UPI001C1F64A6|nr:thioredoxin family protein [Cellulophaga sp. HaHaR_3_176]QWX82789.1 thioredoxin family protein [Cellulophaga sp. HaHaR_3_176]